MEGVVIRFKEGQLSDFGKGKLADRRLEPLGVRQRVLNRDSHIGKPQLRDDGIVGIFDRGMDNAFAVHDDLHVLRANGKQPNRFNEFKTFVHHCCGIDGDFRAHFPVRVLERVGNGDLFEFFFGLAEKRSAGRGQNNLFERRIRRAALQRLKNGGVLGIDRQNRNAVLFRRFHNQLPAGDQRFFIGKREFLFGVDCGKRGL